MLSLSLTGPSPSLSLPPTFINQQVQASFVVWNYGGGTLTGTVSVPAPFSIVSGASFSLLPGQPQEVVVRFSSGTAGSFSRSLSINSNGGNATVTATGVAHRVSFSPGQLDFGSGLLVMRERCNQMGTCGLVTEKVGLPIEKQLTVKNEGTVSVTLTLSTAAPYKIVSVLPTLSPGQSGQVTVRFDPSESGRFTGSLQMGISEGQGSVTAPLVGTAHKIEVSPAELNFGIVFVGSTAERKLTVKNQGVTTVTLEVPHTIPTASPFRIMVESMPGSPLVLGSGESTGVPVQFRPVTLGEFTGAMWLLIGSASLEIPTRGRSYAEAEYKLTVLEYFNWIVRHEQVEGGVLSIEDADRAMTLLLAGYESLTLEQLDAFSRAASILQGSSQLPIQLPPEQGFCLEQPPSRSELIEAAVQFLRSQSAAYVIHLWEQVSRLIGSRLGLSSQDNFNYNFAAFILAIRDLYQTGGSIYSILNHKVVYALETIQNSLQSGNHEYAIVWIDKIVVASRIYLSNLLDNQMWILVDFLRVVDGNGIEQAWTSPSDPNLTIRPPEGTMIDIIVWRQFPGDPANRTLLVFLNVNSSTPDRGGFSAPGFPRFFDVNAMATAMIRWINAVYKHIIQQNSSPVAVSYWLGIRIAGWIFTNPQNPATMDQLIQALRSRQNEMPRDLPFFIAYTADGQPHVVCFNCTTQNEIMAVWMTACQLGGICAPSVQVIGGGGASNISHDMVFLTPGDEGNSGSGGFLSGPLLVADGGGGGGEGSPCGEN